MSSKKKRGVQEGQLVKMLERQRVQQAAEDAAKKGVGAPVLGCLLHPLSLEIVRRLRCKFRIHVPGPLCVN